MNVRPIFIAIILLLSVTAKAQLTEEFPPIIPDAWKKGKVQTKTNNKSTPCGIDTLYYSRYNNSGPTQFLNLQPTRGGGMYFKTDDTVKLYGFNFFGYALQSGIFFTSQAVTCKVYYADANRLPSGAAIASKAYTINASNSSLDELRQEFLFDTPLILDSSFVVTIEFNANLPNRIVLASNNYDSLDGYGRFYSCVKINTNWSNNLNVGGTPFDADFFIEPVVEYKMSANFDHGPNSCLGNGEPFEFINTSAFASNPQFSKGVIDNTLGDDFVWDYGDGSLQDTMFNGLHTFSGNFGYWISLSGSFDNWRGSTCSDDTIIWLEKGEVKASFTYTRNDKVISFTNTSTDADRVEWDFGDGTPKSTKEDPLHYFAASIVFNVKLKAWNKGCVDSTIYELDMKDYTGITSFENEGLSIDMSPNPAVDVLSISTNIPENEKGQFEIYDMQGKVLRSGTFSSNTKTRVDELPKGLYFVRFSYLDTILTKRLVLK